VSCISVVRLSPCLCVQYFRFRLSLARCSFPCLSVKCTLVSLRLSASLPT
jgi:hypothetical protein